MGACARILLASLCAAFAASGAMAQTTAYAPGDGAPNSLQLSIPVTASVRAQCGFATAPSGTHNEPNFDTHAWSHDFPFIIDCSVASRVAVVSANGALLTSGSAPPGYTTSAPYDVALNVVLDAGGPAAASCPVANLTTGGSCTFRGPAAVGQGLAVAVTHNQPGSYVRVSAPAYVGANILVASTGYADTLVVTLSPAT
jgi:hypothetical protein